MQKKGVAPKPEISHTVLAIFLTVAILLSVIGTFWNINRIDRINMLNKLTGYGTTGYVNVTIENISSINVTATDCNFGSGYITTGNVSALLESNGTHTGWSGGGTTFSLEVRNDGNTNLTLNVSSGKSLASFYGTDCSGESCTYQFWSEDKQAGTCTSGLVNYPGTSMDTGNKTVCSLMRHQDTIDELYVHCRLNVTQGIPVGVKTDTWTFWATGL